MAGPEVRAWLDGFRAHARVQDAMKEPGETCAVSGATLVAHDKKSSVLMSANLVTQIQERLAEYDQLREILTYGDVPNQNTNLVGRLKEWRDGAQEASNRIRAREQSWQLLVSRLGVDVATPNAQYFALEAIDRLHKLEADRASANLENETYANRYREACRQLGVGLETAKAWTNRIRGLLDLETWSDQRPRTKS